MGGKFPGWLAAAFKRGRNSQKGISLNCDPTWTTWTLWFEGTLTALCSGGWACTQTLSLETGNLGGRQDSFGDIPGFRDLFVRTFNLSSPDPGPGLSHEYLKGKRSHECRKYSGWRYSCSGEFTVSATGVRCISIHMDPGFGRSRNTSDFARTSAGHIIVRSEFDPYQTFTFPVSDLMPTHCRVP